METAFKRPSTYTVLVTLFVTTFVVHYVAGSPLHVHVHECLENQTEDGVLRFEETSNIEFALEKQFKELSCYAENFCTIKWMKDGKPIDKDLEQSLLVRGQVLRFESVEEKDGGVYTCIASRDSESIQQDITFEVIKDCNENRPAINIQHRGCINTTADVGNNVTFHCEYFVGKHTVQIISGSWFKHNKSAGLEFSSDASDNWFVLPSLPEGLDKHGTVFTTSASFSRMKGQDESSCECSCTPVFVVELNIWNVSDFAYGTYALWINNDGRGSLNTITLFKAVTAPSVKVPVEDVMRIFVIPGACVVMILVVTALMWHRFATDIKLMYRDHVTITSEDAMKSYDVYLSYDWNSDVDSVFARKLVCYMQEKGYKVFWEINCLPGGDTDDDIVRALERSRRSVIIFSPDYLASRRNFDVIFSMDQAKHYKKEIIPIIYRDISNVTEETQSNLVKHVLSSRCLRFDQITTHPPNAVKKIVQKVLGDPRSEQSLHKELLLRLPRPNPTSQALSTSSEENFTTAEIRPYVSSRMSMTRYTEEQRQVYDQLHIESLTVLETGQNAQRLYPSISRYVNLEVNI
ncbi:interleukin-1 receptor accessory protein-like 1-B [Asterias amurensis]|uniref:interleukin-1 receptor accessory protein-like 1-B n=1 Tax=Asterias amurensis TaxID=7602 RepID=UPI003AB1AA31